MFTRSWLISLPDLATVDEQSALDEERIQAANVAAEQDAAADANDDFAARRESAHSGISGTTAKTSFSQEEIAELDPDVMVDVLPNLASAAEQLAKLLVPAEMKSRPVIWKEIRIDGSRHSKLFNNRVASLMVHKDSFGSQEYIQPSVVLRALLGVQTMEEVPAAPWRPDNIIYQVNLAQMLRTTLVFIQDPTELDTEGYNALSTLLTQFATAIAGPLFDVEAVRTCLALQAQLSVCRLHIFQAHPNYVPTAIVDETFFTREDDGRLVYVLQDALGMGSLGDADLAAWHDTIEQLVDGLKSPFQTGDPNLPAALGALRATYPWHQFVEQAVQYYEARKARLDQEIAAAGGLTAIVGSLTEEVERRDIARRAEVKRQSFTYPGSTPNKAFGSKAISNLKARQQRLSGLAPQPQTAPVAQMMDPRLTQDQEAAPAQDDWVQPAEDDYDGQPTAQQRAQSTLQHLSGFQDLQRQNAKKGKARSFIERQDTAHRVTFDESQQSQPYLQQGADYQPEGVPGRSSATGPYHVSPARSSNKRAYAHGDDDLQDFEPTQDEGFQTDLRDTAAADERRRAAQTARPQRPRAHPAGSVGTVDYEYPGSTSASARPSPSKRPRKNPGSTIPPPIQPLDPDDGPLPDDQSYQRAKVLAKHGRVVASQNRPPQVRMPWLNEEENALINLIVEHGGDGISYAALKKHDDHEGPVLARRSAEDMRFKARNMKLTFLMGQVRLPENWEHVVLDKKAMDKLAARGINYYQDRIRGGVLDVDDEAPGA
ncbi:hypothetical protein LTR36_000649 [Oleoguttula mirabilis]|uniref:Myb-like domain-containing protein n=1 Tax=Oleoguttula mirabilis TaxID=1507867 RepID=A0AAV9JT26_9PEZI|nr:hypothetical protein LTR36_000649 [Oleoguttula mirabilis]